MIITRLQCLIHAEDLLRCTGGKPDTGVIIPEKAGKKRK